ncbi:M15 family metallopeptidase [Streptodolium elevatio]|uniref:M15 family metallopeptidase n=1 Tax=Streptodolium elevatio TaxID=3157996 RepID=A0ABV3DUX7_9ACTN
MILLNDPRVRAVDIHDCGEPLVEITGAPGLLLDDRERDPHGSWGRVRTGVLARLCTAATKLPEGLQLLVIEGHRSAAEQQRRFEAYAEGLRRAGVDDPTELRCRTSAFVSPVEVAPHCAGAAVDVTLADPAGHELDMGGPVNGHRSGHEASCAMHATHISPQARLHRDILTAAMTAAGFVNYPSEWWHWSHGDRYWALLTPPHTAHYGPI